jgi:hypothetical protein
VWEFAGPFEKEGGRLLEEPFAPERPDAPSVQWKPLPSKTDTDKPWLLEFGKIFGGQNSVVYVRTNLWSSNEQKARLELGSDAGLKVWLNGKLVHTNNTIHRLTLGGDIVPVALQKGWNSLMIKSSQEEGAWEACARMRAPNGDELLGVRVSPTQN